MKGHRIKIIALFLFVIVLVACDDNNYQMGLPAEKSPAFTEFMSHHVFGYGAIPLFTDDDTYIYSKRNFSPEQKTINYFQTSSLQLNEYYEPFFEAENYSKTLHTLFNDSNKWNELQHELDEEYRFLPAVSLHDRSSLTIELNGEEADISIVEELNGQISESDELVINLTRVNHEGFVLHVENYTKEEHYYLFGLSDLSSVDIFIYDELKGADLKDDLAIYYPIFKEINDTEQFVHIVEKNFVDLWKDQSIQIKSEHVLSEDYQFVYLNGNQIKDGNQRIQKTSEFLDKSDDYYIEFHLDTDEIADEMDFDSVGINQASVVYFNRDFVILSLSYDSAITGTAGSTNVIVDFQEDREDPSFYLVDLGLS